MPRPSMPAPEAEALRQAYAGAGVILEYGAGGSTRMAAGLPGDAVFAVESDVAWADEVASWCEANAPARHVVIHAVDLGPTGRWGYPQDESGWSRFHRYPLGVWERSDFRHPDVVLIDGRFRAACFLAVRFRIDRPVTVFWDDYRDRPAYHEVERYGPPAEVVGRMARFEVEPAPVPKGDLAWIMDMFTRAQ